MTAASQQPISLALVITELEPGGAEQCLVRLATGVDRRRFEPVVYSLAPPPVENKTRLVRELSEANVPVHFLGATHWTDFLRVRRELARLLRAQRATVMQAFLHHANILGVSAARRAGVPHRFAGLRVEEPRKMRWRLEGWFFRQAEGIVCVSQEIEKISRGYRFPAKKLVTIPNGVDVNVYATAAPVDKDSLGVPRGAPFIVSVGRLDKQKGFDQLLDLAPQVFAALPQHHLVIAGEGPERAALEQQAQRLGVADRVHLVGYRSDVPAILQAADVFVMTSRYEGFSNALLEAMASGLPLALSRSAVSIDDFETGDLYDEQVLQPEKLAPLIIKWATDREQARERGAKNRDFATENFSLTAMIEAYQNLWERAARSPR